MNDIENARQLAELHADLGRHYADLVDAMVAERNLRDQLVTVSSKRIDAQRLAHGARERLQQFTAAVGRWCFCEGLVSHERHCPVSPGVPMFMEGK